MPETEIFLRQQIIDTAQTLGRRGLSPGLSGNVSARLADGLLITPSAMEYEDLLPEDIVFVAGNGEVSANQRKPSTETPFHSAKTSAASREAPNATWPWFASKQALRPCNAEIVAAANCSVAGVR